jgi:aminomethyltransferase
MQTPLYEAHRALHARMAPFAGWDMPIQYAGILAEHEHTRKHASIFDVCHMGEFDIRGPRAEADLERLVTCRISTIKDGQCRYGFLLQEDGGVLDDLTVYRRDAEHFFLVVNAGTREGDAEWIRAHLSDGTTFTDLSTATAKLDVQGPHARDELEQALCTRLPDLGYFRFADGDLAGTPCTISRTGYTGEWGYEFYFPATEARRTWDFLLENSGIKPAGLGARDTLRLEVGYALYGHELSAQHSPVACTRGMFIDRSKDFIGKEAVVRDLDEGVPRYLVGLQLETRRAARAHDKVLSAGKVVGEVTSGAPAPSLGVAVALAYVDRDLCEPGQALELDVRGTPLKAQVVELPFYKEGSARGKVSES